MYVYADGHIYWSIEREKRMFIYCLCLGQDEIFSPVHIHVCNLYMPICNSKFGNRESFVIIFVAFQVP